MLAGGPMALSALFFIQANTQLEAGARIETRVGEAPTGTQQVTSGQTGQAVTVAAEQAQVMVVATPSLRLHWLADIDDLQADSSSRILWRPVPLLHSRPLFLETFGVTHIRRPSGRSSWRLDLRGTYGEQDYTSLSQQFANQPALPLSTTMFMVNGTAETLWRSSRRSTLTFQLGAVHRQSLDGQTTAGEASATTFFTPLPTQTTVTATPALLFALTRHSVVQASVPVSDYDIQKIVQPTSQTGQLNVVSVQPQLNLLEELTRRHQLHLLAGFTYAAVLHGPNTDLGYHFTPLTQVDLNSHLYRARTSAVDSSVGAGTSYYVDPVLGRGVWRGIAQASVNAQMGFHWSAGARVAFSTDITAPAVAGGPPVDGTLAAADFSVRYRWPNLLVAEFGGRFSERAPRLSSPDFTWHERELWAFLSLYAATRVSWTTARSPSNAIQM
jgi:hypothetical protein